MKRSEEYIIQAPQGTYRGVSHKGWRLTLKKIPTAGPVALGWEGEGWPRRTDCTVPTVAVAPGM